MSVFKKMLHYSDIGMAGLVMLIVVMMIIPLPTWLLDVLLTVNITLGVVVLLSTFYAQRALDLAAFPTMLLIVTLFRLALNVSTTRLILLNADAGQVISAFGNFVVGGNYVVGAVVFLILVIIQFLVITKGAERVAEVAARFTLDAMPGKQMAIDADLNAGLIDESGARERRLTIQREADFYGAMDGASKFVKGDAIAGLIITLINIIGGLSIGVLQRGLPLERALGLYSLLTVGDGLVSQIPALLFSTATGVIVTRAAGQTDLGKDIFTSLRCPPRNGQSKYTNIFPFRNDASDSFRFLSSLSQTPVFLRCEISVRGMEPAAVVKYLHIFEHRRAGFFPRPEPPALKPFIFQLAPKGLHRGVVPAVPLS
jgi:flagellar biosynthesis protein FlhA